MSRFSPLEPNYIAIIVTTMVMLSVIGMVGTLLVPLRVMRGSRLSLLALRLTSGLLFVVGMTATISLQRFCYLSLIPVLQIGAAVLLRRDRGVLEEDGEAVWSRSEWAALGSVVVGALLFTFWYQQWLFTDGTVRQFHSDLGYFIELVMQVPVAHVANGWSVILGPKMMEAGAGGDLWYHWGAIFLAIAARACSGLPAIAALLGVAVAVMNTLLVIVAGAVVQTLTKQSVGRCLFVGACSLLSVQWLRLFGVAWFAEYLPFGLVQHTRWTLAEMLSYKFEGVLLLTTMMVWLRQRVLVAALLLFCAGLSAPHTVGSFGAMAGTLAFIALLLRDWRMLRVSLVMIALLLAAWFTVHFGFGSSLPKAEGQHLVQWSLADLFHSARAALMDAGIGCVVGALLMPGILHLIRARDAEATAEMRMLGWMAVAGILGSYAAFSVMHTMADRFHFVLLIHAVLIMPAGIWGWARMGWQVDGARRYGCWAVIGLAVIMGISDLMGEKGRERPAAWRQQDVAIIREALGGRPFGYFASSDRQWWIPKNTVLASLLESRCVRISELEKNDIYTRFYGADLVHELVPKLDAETSEAWSLRLAAKLGIHHLLEIGSDTLPPTVKSQVKEIASAAGLRLFEILPASP